MKYIGINLLLILLINTAYSQRPFQQDTLKKFIRLDEVVVSANKWEQQLNEIPHKIIKAGKSQILFNNPQTAADLLGQTGAVFIQKSQMGGGSPMIRGFATNRVLLVVDGVRMNNAIYRSGNLQNVISIDALSTENAEVIFGPGSLTYGSDAIGGVMDFHTLEPRFSQDNKLQVAGSALTRYSSANKEKTGHADVNFQWQRWSLLTSVSYSAFDDLKMGRHGGQDRYLRPEYVERKNDADVIVPNADPRIQRFSGYNQLNILQKVRYKPSDDWDVQYGFTYARTGNAPRYDRLIQYRNGKLRFAEWNYGPMLWQMHHLQAMHSSKKGLYDNLRTTVAYQNYEESRIDRQLNSSTRTIQAENVNAVSINLDATKQIKKNDLFYGVEYVYNKVGSMGEQTNMSSGTTVPYVSRYPNGSIWSTTGIYGSYKMNLHPKFSLTTGLRYSYNTLNATFDQTFIKFPYDNARLKHGAFTGNAGLVYRPGINWKVSGNISTGYRMPNVDDIGKLFESVPGNVTVPNPALTPEYAWNFEAGISKVISSKLRIEVNGFHTILDNAITLRSSTFNGEDSILFDGTMSRVEKLQNVAKATVWGLQTGVQIYLTSYLSLQSYANLIKGKETDDVNDEQVPLRQAPPFYGSASLQYARNKLKIEASASYNSTIKNEDLAPSEQGKTDIYAVDANGKPYSPAWYTLNLKASYQLMKEFSIVAGWENMTNQRYRPYSSGIVAAGSNAIITLRAAF